MSEDRAAAAKAAWEIYMHDVSAAFELRSLEFFRPMAKQWSDQGNGTARMISLLRAEKTPSFYLYTGRGWCDFGTNEGGTALSLIMRVYNCTFREAVDRAAAFCGLETWDERKKRTLGSSGSSVAAMTPAELDDVWNVSVQRDRVFEVMSALQHMAWALLPHRQRDHLRSHYGLTDAYIDFEKIGFCPVNFWQMVTEPNVMGSLGDPDGVNPFCLLGKYTREELLETGWFYVSGSGEVTCIFEGRIVFAYWMRAQCMYTIGRQYFGNARKEDATIEDWDSGKYKKLALFEPRKRPYVSPHIKNILWGVDTLRAARDGLAIVTEGMTDAMMLAQLGFAVLSPITVTFRKADFDEIKARLKEARISRVVILNDADVIVDPIKGDRRPGLEGAKATAAMLVDDFDVRIGLLPKPEGVAKIDINEIGAAAMRAGGEDAATATMQGLADRARPYVDFLIEDLDVKATPEDLDRQIREIGKLSVGAPHIARSARVTLLRGKLPAHPRSALAASFNSGVAEAASARAILEQKAKDTERGEAARKEKAGKIDTAGMLVGAVYEDIHGYDRINPTGGTDRITNFTLQLVEMALQERGPAWLVVRVWQEGVVIADRWAVNPKAWGSKRAFIGAMPNAKMQYTGSDDNVQGILNLLAENIDAAPKLELTKLIGRHANKDGARYVLPCGTLDRSGWMTAPDFLLESEGASLSHKFGDLKSVSFEDVDVLALAQRFFNEAPTLHEESNAAIAIGWMMASLFRQPWGARHAGAFPILNVYGRPGSGKSSFFAKLLWPAFCGIEKTEPLSCTSTPFAMIRDLSSTNAFAILQDEYKLSDMNARQVEQVMRYARKCYAGEDETRGRQDQTIAHYPMVAPLIIMGETRLAEDQALHERCVFLSLSGRWLVTHPERAQTFADLSQAPLWKIAPLIWRWSLSVDVGAMIDAAGVMADEVLAKLDRSTLPIRIRNGVKAILFGLMAFDAACTAFGAAVPQTSPFDVVNRILSESLEHEESDRPHVPGTPRAQPLDSLDLWLRDASMLATANVIEEGVHYFWIDGQLRLYVKLIDAALTKWSNDHGQPKHSPGAQSLLRIAAEKREALGSASYIASTRKRTRVSQTSTQRVWCLSLEPNRAPETLSLVSFPCSSPRTNGGLRGPDPLRAWREAGEGGGDEDDDD